MSELKMRHLLSVDFDFWFEIDSFSEADWGHRESEFFLDAIWHYRAAAAIAAGEDPATKWAITKQEPHPRDFAKIIHSKGCRQKRNSVAIAESHGIGYKSFSRFKGPLHLVQVDAHHDFGYNMPELNCDNWIYHLARLGSLNQITLIYPKWRLGQGECGDWVGTGRAGAKRLRDMGIHINVRYGLGNFPRNLTFQKTLVAHSGAWVPPWLDNGFQQLCDGILFYGNHDKCRWFGHRPFHEACRDFDWQAAGESAKKMVPGIGRETKRKR